MRLMVANISRRGGPISRRVSPPGSGDPFVSIIGAEPFAHTDFFFWRPANGVYLKSQFEGIMRPRCAM
jgi:hypothetical protein